MLSVRARKPLIKENYTLTSNQEFIYKKNESIFSQHSKTILALIIIIAFVFIWSSNLNNSSNNSGSSSIFQSKYYPVTVNTFSTVKEGELIRFYFLLADSSGNIIPRDGRVKLQILDDYQTLLYSNEFDVSSSQFVDYQIKLTGAYLGKAYEWRVNSANFKKSFGSYGYGKAYLTFTSSSDNRKLSSESSVTVPCYTSEEIKQICEQQYLAASTTVNLKLTKGNYEVIVIRVGFFNDYSYLEKKQYLRVDIQAKNIGSQASYFSPSGMAIIDNQNHQYDRTYGGSMDLFSNIYPGVSKSGYILFEVPNTVTSGKLVFQQGYDVHYNNYIFEYILSWRTS